MRDEKEKKMRGKDREIAWGDVEMERARAWGEGR